MTTLINKIQQLWRKRALRLVVEGLLVLLVFMAFRVYSQRDMVNGEVPPLQAQLLSGETFQLTAQTQRPLLLHFWASWCPICKLEQDSIQSLSEDYNVVTVAMQSGSQEEVAAFLQQQGLDFAVINDPDGLLAQRFGVRAVPASFIIDKKNQIRFHESGYSSEWGLRARLWWSQ